MQKAPENLKTWESLIQIVAALRGPEGCPWDLEQSHLSLAPYCLEEACELIEAIEKNEDVALKDELGDVLFQVVLHAQLASERKAFTLQDVLENLNTKMVRRHPHVFADKKVTDSKEVWLNWEKIKKAEKKSLPEGFHIAPTLPALQTAYKIGVKTEKAGFDWSDVKDVIKKVKEELQELEEALSQNNKEATFEEMGDLLFSAAQLARHLDMEPEQSLRAANRKFELRYFKMRSLAQQQGLDFESLKDSEKENLWQQIKETR
jgi:tetrapyrrole methylase family protein/MazG family protein